MNKKPRALWKRRLAYFISKKGVMLCVASIAMALPALFLASDSASPAHATIREIIDWLYAGSTALLAGFVFLVATLESQEPVRLKRGFYIESSGIFIPLVIHLFTTLCVICDSIEGFPLLITETLVFTNALYIVLMICAFLIIFISPERRNSATRHFLIHKIKYYYAVYTAFSKEQTVQQNNINTILMKYGIGYSSNLHRNSYYTPIASGAPGYVAPKKNHLRQLGRRVRKTLQHSSTSRQKDEINVYHCIAFDERIAPNTPLLFIPREIEGTSTVHKTLSRLLAKKVCDKKNPTFTKTTYISTMQSFQELMLQEQSIDVFQDYSKILQELLFRYLEHDYLAEERARDAKSAPDPFRILKLDHSILAWYHRIAKALVRSEKAEDAEDAEWIEEILDLYRKPVWYLCGQATLPQKLLGDFLHELERRYYQARRPNQAQTELQRRIMHQYDAFRASLCTHDQNMEAEEAITPIAAQIITVHQAGILKSVYDQSDITTFKKNVSRFITPLFMLSVDNFLQMALQSIIPITRHSLSHRIDSDTVKKTYWEYCSFQKMVTLFRCAGYIFCNKGFSVTYPAAADDPYLAFLIDNGLPTSRTEFIYLYGKLHDTPATHPDNSIFWQYPNRTGSSAHIPSKSMSDGTEEFFCWYNIHKCEPTPSLDEGEISQLFSADFRRQAKGLAQRFTALIDNSDEGTLTEQQKYAVGHTIEFLHSLSK